MKSTIFITFAGLMVASWPALAQVADTPEIAQTLREMGPVLSRQVVGGTNEIYAPLYPAMPVEGVELIADQRYGEAERNLLDVYKPADADGTAPIVIFAHGGGFVRGDKAEVANLGPYFAQNDVVFLAMNYRLAPDAKWPAGAEDMAAAIRWVRDNTSVHGGNLANIIVAGNSAGSAHAADYAFREDMQIDDDGVIGAILISPPTANLTDHQIDPERDAQYYDTSTAPLDEMSYIGKLDGRALPVMIAVGELDIPLVQDQAGQLLRALYERDGHLPVTAVVPGHNHISIVAHIGSGDASLGPDMLEFIRYAALFPTE
ncbi:MAG: alpha/beta hydrolase [Paracoccus denitrificans]|uniref:Alpha/beta hydrolase n=1 Tax=Paracoccus denitrificans TaxID=266 RepID=A0A533I200_PARDE|nr:MAG: alpha/beta hydrolase [Paracoccus denitrificans]